MISKTSPNRGQITAYTARFEDRRESKRVKILSHRLFPRADWWLWLDWPFRLTVPAEQVPKLGDIVGFKHRFHADAYEEHAACARMRKDDLDVMRRQMDRYCLERFPKGFGLIECGVLLRRNCPQVVAFNEAWWSEVEHGSSRDQLSVGYAAWKTGVRWECWDGTVYENGITCAI